jgi:hypothetical protein
VSQKNTNEKHIKTALWAFPLYLFIINIFVIPIALGSIIKEINTSSSAFVLSFPVITNHPLLALFVFIGGISAGISMIMICSTSIALMTTNYIVLPITNKIKFLHWIKRYILQVRWLVVGFLVSLGYIFKIYIGESNLLVKIGMISFAAVAQFAPPIIGGLFWKKGNKFGAIVGLLSGSLIWFYTAMIPSVIRSGWLPESILEKGLFGISFLKPESLFGVDFFEPLAHTLFFSMLFNIGLYVIISLYTSTKDENNHHNSDFIDILKEDSNISNESLTKDIDLEEKKKIIFKILHPYFDTKKTKQILENSLIHCNIKTDKINIFELAELNSQIEKTLATVIGTASAYTTIKKSNLINSSEAINLGNHYGVILANLNLTPKQMKKKIDFYNDRSKIFRKQSQELEKIVKERTKKLEAKNEELEKFNKFAIDRELRMIELKKKIKELEKIVK